VHRSTISRRHGFTLVELLVAIAIIGVLAAIAVPTAYRAYLRAKIAAQKIEVTNISTAIEQYKQKFGDYPPDGSSWAVVERHLRKAFPRMVSTELTVLQAACGGTGSGTFPAGVLNRAEALVFFLGGFSTDPLHPFTGPGGPFVIVSGSPVYNTDRQNAIYDFGSNLLIASADETDYGMAAFGSAEPADIMPVYRLKGSTVPVAYFDSRTYAFTDPGFGMIYNNYETLPAAPVAFGTARPYLSTTMSTMTGSNKYQNDKTFQIVAPGLDNRFGGYSSTLGTVLFIFPTGAPVVVGTPPAPAPSNRYNSSQDLSAQFDNITNFSEATLEDGLPN
jgi:prepilin-type N-terminal cleavage/methylation domain-containing protein